MAVFESKYREGMDREEGINLVAEAICSGIFNDLGSGSTVDVCVITKDKTEYLRNHQLPNPRTYVSSRGYAFAPGHTDILTTKIISIIMKNGMDPSDTSLVVKDGYQWRKYGQKVTRDNPYPKAYYKCSFAPLCPVKKKVQRIAEDRSILVAINEGEHIHVRATSTCNTGSNISCSSSATVKRDMTGSKELRVEKRGSGLNTESEEFKRLLAEQMALSLSNDPGFKEALASAVSEKFTRFDPKYCIGLGAFEIFC